MNEVYAAWLPYGLALGLVVVALLAARWGRIGRPVELPGLLQQVGEAAALARELVAAAEQLWLTGRLQRNERFDYVAAQLQSYFPNLEVEQIIPLIEAAVYGLKLLKQQLPDDLPVPLGRATGGQGTGGRHAGAGGA